MLILGFFLRRVLNLKLLLTLDLDLIGHDGHILVVNDLDLRARADDYFIYGAVSLVASRRFGLNQVQGDILVAAILVRHWQVFSQFAVIRLDGGHACGQGHDFFRLILVRIQRELCTFQNLALIAYLPQFDLVIHTVVVRLLGVCDRQLVLILDLDGVGRRGHILVCLSVILFLRNLNTDGQLVFRVRLLVPGRRLLLDHGQLNAAALRQIRSQRAVRCADGVLVVRDVGPYHVAARLDAEHCAVQFFPILVDLDDIHFIMFDIFAGLLLVLDFDFFHTVNRHGVGHRRHERILGFVLYGLGSRCDVHRVCSLVLLVACRRFCLDDIQRYQLAYLRQILGQGRIVCADGIARIALERQDSVAAAVLVVIQSELCAVQFRAVLVNLGQADFRRHVFGEMIERICNCDSVTLISIP